MFAGLEHRIYQHLVRAPSKYQSSELDIHVRFFNYKKSVAISFILFYNEALQFSLRIPVKPVKSNGLGFAHSRKVNILKKTR